MSIDAAVPVSYTRRSLDVAVAAPALVLLAPVFAAIGAAIRLESRGPVFFRQLRVGAGAVPFTLVKFRTMRNGAAGPQITQPGDARVTGVGRFLRSTSLDELPQLFNVLVGDMTLVGPRPETPALAARYPAECQAVFRYRPGMTGPAQIRLRDTDVLPDGEAAEGEDLDTYYLTTVVPARVRLDFEYLVAPTLSNTVMVLAETARYLVTARPRRARERYEWAVGHSAR